MKFVKNEKENEFLFLIYRNENILLCLDRVYRKLSLNLLSLIKHRTLSYCFPSSIVFSFT